MSNEDAYRVLGHVASSMHITIVADLHLDGNLVQSATIATNLFPFVVILPGIDWCVVIWQQDLQIKREFW